MWPNFLTCFEQCVLHIISGKGLNIDAPVVEFKVAVGRIAFSNDPMSRVYITIETLTYLTPSYWSCRPASRSKSDINQTYGRPLVKRIINDLESPKLRPAIKKPLT